MLLLLGASDQTSQIEFSMYQKASERVELGVLHSFSAMDASAGTFSLAAKYRPSEDSAIKV